MIIIIINYFACIYKKLCYNYFYLCREIRLIVFFYAKQPFGRYDYRILHYKL